MSMSQKPPSVLDDLGEEITGVAWPVSACMAITIFLVRVLNPEGSTSSSTVFIASAAYDENKNPNASSSEKFGGALLNAVIFIAVIVAMTFILVLLFKYECYRVIFAYMGFAVANIFFLITGLLIVLLCQRGKVHIDSFSLVFILFNFSVVGTLGVLFMPVPLLMKQCYMVWVGIIVAYIFTWIPDWTSWVLLVAMALYDIAAVLIPGGPLKWLVDIAVQRQQALPALVYESRPAGGYRGAGHWANRGGRAEGDAEQPLQQEMTRQDGRAPAAAAGAAVGAWTGAGAGAGAGGLAVDGALVVADAGQQPPQQWVGQGQEQWAGQGQGQGQGRPVGEGKEGSEQLAVAGDAAAAGMWQVVQLGDSNSKHCQEAKAGAPGARVGRGAGQGQRARGGWLEAEGGQIGQGYEASSSAGPRGFGAAAGVQVRGLNPEAGPVAEGHQPDPMHQPLVKQGLNPDPLLDQGLDSDAENPGPWGKPRGVAEAPGPGPGAPAGVGSGRGRPQGNGSSQSGASVTSVVMGLASTMVAPEPMPPGAGQYGAGQYGAQQQQQQQQHGYALATGTDGGAGGYYAQPQMQVPPYAGQPGPQGAPGPGPGDPRAAAGRGNTLVDPLGAPLDPNNPQQPAAARSADSDDGFDMPDGIKLGLGDFIFYSMLVGKAAMYDMMTVYASFIGIIAGLGLTLLCLAIYNRPLPALPFSIALGVLFYFLTRIILEPYVVTMGTAGAYY